jgi:low affinity Fe/Cu permease
MQDIFRKFANIIADIAGTFWVFSVALFVVIVWALSGPLFGFSDTWQLVINTGTTIITFLMVFLIQNTQKRDNRALHAKLDELIVHQGGAHNELAMAEAFTDEELGQLRKHFETVAAEGGTRTEDRLPPAAKNGAKRNGRKSRAKRTSKSR